MKNTVSVVLFRKLSQPVVHMKIPGFLTAVSLTLQVVRKEGSPKQNYSIRKNTNQQTNN